jgi:acetaldehyde dehydrogenase/alcohol dehydrogenase
MDSFQERANDFLFRAVIAAGEFQQLDQEMTDKIVESVYKAGFDNRIKLAKMASDETGLGVWQHKVIKNVLATQFVYNDIKDLKTVGIISEDRISGVMEIAQPLGPIFALIPVTNPTSTTLFKILIALKTRNPIIVSPSRKAENCCAETVRICYNAALKAGAPEDCIQIVRNGSRDLTRAIMSHKNLALTLATGGTSMVHAAYSSGNPAIGVGPGNVPVLIDRSADIPFAVENVITSKTFDNGTICASEQSIIVEKAIANDVQKEFEKQGCYFANDDEIKMLEDYVIHKEKSTMNPDVVGQSAHFIAENAGFEVPENTKIILARIHGVGEDYPLSKEILAPVLAYYVCEDYDDAIKTCIDLNYLGGIGHSAAIYANDEDRISEFSQLMNAGRILINTPSAQGAVGGLYNGLDVSLTLGCGTGGKNITTENISARHLMNIQRACRLRENGLWFKFDTGKYLDETLTNEEILNSYYKNH